MKSFLYWIASDGNRLEAERCFSLDECRERATGKSAVFGLGREAGSGIVVDHPSIRRYHLSFNWKARHATWSITNEGPTGTVRVNGSDLGEKENRLLLFNSCLIEIGDQIEGEGCLFRFERTPEAPQVGGRDVRELSLVHDKIIIGRGTRSKDSEESNALRLCLDPDIRTISSKQVEIRKEGKGFKVINHNSGSAVRTVLNGDQNFDERELVFGDCIQMPGYSYYTFQFMGSSLVHVGGRGTIQARSLTRIVGSGNKTKKILNTVDLDLSGGEFVGILGGSGQGKSTLLNALCGIFPASSGDVWLDGRKLRGTADMAIAGIGYVPQDDIVHGELTVEQALFFAGRLRLKLRPALLRQAVVSLLETLQLTEHRTTQVSRLSGGQRKRVSIASELLTSPRFLLLDEPTSGLDPQTEKSLMDELSMLARQKRMGVICTTHVLQNSHVFSSVGFIQGGRLIFCGKPLDAVRYFLLGRPFEDGPAVASSPSPMVESATSTGPASQSKPNFQEGNLLDKLPHVYDVVATAAKRRVDSGSTSAEVAEWMEKSFNESTFKRELRPIERAASKSEKNLEVKASKPSFFKSFKVLCQRQNKILWADKLNVLFLLAQALLIGGLVGWVSENLVFQMFLSVIATLWFGCSNGAQQIVGELAIFRRERLAGLGLNSYLFSKVIFVTVVTSMQAILLYFAVLVASHTFHSDLLVEYGEEGESSWERDRKAFESMIFVGTSAGKEETAESKAADEFTIVFDESLKQFELDNAPKTHYRNPSRLKASDAEFTLMANLSWFFRVRQNMMDRLKVVSVQVPPGQTFDEGPKVSWIGELSLLLGLRFAGLLAAAMVGVGLGLVISALVRTPTQAAMWVPLILIPQILFGGFVVTSPEMDNSVFAFSRFLPSYNVQQLMDVANLYGRNTPRITNKTKIPGFFEEPPYEKETVYFRNRAGSQLEKYDKLSQVNKSWQNLLVTRHNVGERMQAPDKDSVESRVDVFFTKGQPFLLTGAVVLSLTILGGWLLLSYGLILFGLIKKQSGK